MDGKGEGGGGGFANDGGGDSPMSLDDIERPPLRQVDKYIKAECPCLSTRYTIALMTCFGFIISFGMKCNMGMAKLQFKNGVSFFCFLNLSLNIYKNDLLTFKGIRI